MNKSITILSLFLCFSCSIVFSQNMIGQKPESNIPVIISIAFSEKFPTAEPIWFTNYQGRYNQQLVYEGRFMWNKRYSSAIYDKDGNLLAFVEKIYYDELPENVIKYMKENYPTFPIVDSIRVTTQNKDITYELGILIDGQFVIKVFSEKGDFIKSTLG